MPSRASESELMPSDEPVSPDTQLQFKINSKIDDSLESTRRMKQMMEESRCAGTDALTALDNQGSQLNQIEADLGIIGGQVDQSARIVTQMERCCCYDLCCCCRCCSSSKETDDETAVAWRKNAAGVTVISSQSQLDRSHNDYTSGYSLASSFSGGLVNRVTDDFREDEMDDNLSEVHSVINVLRHMALDQGSTISQQNEQISRINEHAVGNEDKIRGVNKRMQKMLD